MIRKKLSFFITLFLLIFLSLVIFLGKYTDRVVDPYVRSLLEGTKPIGHQIEYRKIRVNLFEGKIMVKDVKIFPDTSLGDNKVKMELICSTIRLTEFKIWTLIKDKRLIVGDLIVEDPNVSFTLPLKIEDAVNEVKERQAPKPKKELLREIFLNKIILSGGRFSLYRADTLLARSEEISFEAQSINLKRNSLDEPIGYTFGDIRLRLTNTELFTEKGLYDMKLGSFEASKRDSSLVMEGFKMIPKYSKKDFSGKLKFQNDRFDLNISRIEIAHIGLQRWLDGELLMVSKVWIDDLDADIYRDKNVAFDLNRFPPFYNESFLKIPIPLVIDTVTITHSKVKYSELVAGNQVAGTITLEDFKLQSYNLTNQAADDTIVHEMQLNIQALVMGEGPLNLKLTLPLKGNLHHFKCSGSVGAMKLSPLNDMLAPSINMKFNNGRLNRMTFSFAATDHYSNGWMEFLYQDLEVELMKKDPDKEWGLVSKLANSLALSNNPAPGKDLKIVEIGYERDKNKGIINYVWKTIQSGMIHTILPIKKYQINRKNDPKEDQEKQTRESRKKEKRKN